jgi:hypothetical protein
MVTSIFEISEQGLTNWNVLWSRIVVQLLMPLLVEMTSLLRYLMSMHDMQNLIPDLLTVTGAFTNK